MPASPFESETLQEQSKILNAPAKSLLLVFPELDWNLKRSGSKVGAVQYMATALLITIGAFFITGAATTLPSVLMLGIDNTNPMIALGIPVLVSVCIFFYILFMPKLTVTRQAKLIDKDLEYMLKDMQIQMSAGVPLFNTLANIAGGGYGACSKLIGEVVQEVEGGSSMRDVLNNYGMISPSEYMRRALWQIANAMQTGSDIKTALVALSNDIRQEKENKISIYGQELSLLGLVYMMIVIVAPSMGVTLLLILSSFLGGQAINMTVFWGVLAGIIGFQFVFISIIRSKRPCIE